MKISVSKMSKHPVMWIPKKQLCALAELGERWKRIPLYESFQFWQMRIFPNFSSVSVPESHITVSAGTNQPESQLAVLCKCLKHRKQRKEHCDLCREVLRTSAPHGQTLWVSSNRTLSAVNTSACPMYGIHGSTCQKQIALQSDFSYLPWKYC